MIRSVVRYGCVPFMLLGVNGSAMALASLGFGELWMVAVIAVAVLCSFVAERLLPYAPGWNAAQSDAGRDTAHSFVNESLILLSVAVLPALAAVNPLDGYWPSGLPFVAQVLMSILIADLGITLVHLASHKVGWMWRFHSVHRITRFYGLNGLMKHPIHQAPEMAGGVLPLILLSTYSFDPGRRFVSDDLGMAAKPNYPTRYLAQLAEPFRPSDRSPGA